MLKLLCAIGLHMWGPDAAWGSRCCRLCGNTEIRMYTSEKGVYWEKVS